MSQPDYYQRLGKRVLIGVLALFAVLFGALLFAMATDGVEVTDERVSASALFYDHAIDRADIVRVEPIASDLVRSFKTAKWGRIGDGTRETGWFKDADGEEVFVSANVTRDLVRIVPRQGAAMIVEASQVPELLAAR